MAWSEADVVGGSALDLVEDPLNARPVLLSDGGRHPLAALDRRPAVERLEAEAGLGQAEAEQAPARDAKSIGHRDGAVADLVVGRRAGGGLVHGYRLRGGCGDDRRVEEDAVEVFIVL